MWLHDKGQKHVSCCSFNTESLLWTLETLVTQAQILDMEACVFFVATEKKSKNLLQYISQDFRLFQNFKLIMGYFKLFSPTFESGS